MNVSMRIKRYNPEVDSKPYWAEYRVEADPIDRLLDALNTVKWTMDGATTLAEAAARFRERADELDELARAGFELEQPVSDDYAFIVRPGEESPMRLVEDDE